MVFINKLIFFILLLLSDLMSIFISMLFAYFSRNFFALLFHLPTIGWERLYFSWWVILLIVIVFIYNGLYVKRMPFWEESKDIIFSLLSAFIIAFAIMSLGKIHDVSRLLVVFWMGISFILVPVARYFVKAFISKKGIYRDNLMIIGVNEVAVKAAEVVLKQPTMGYRLVAFLDDLKELDFVNINGNKVKAMRGIRHFRLMSRILDVGTIMVAKPSLSEDKLVDLANKIHMSSHKVLFVPGIKGVALLNAEIIPPFMDNLLLVHLRNNLMYARNRIFKRVLDFILSLLGIIVLSPVFLIIVIAVKLSSPGNIFYKQYRIGYKGRPFYVYKFRTMYQDAEKRLQELLRSDENLRKEWEASHKLTNDPRITPLGKFLRKTSLDELPQLFNVLKGDMYLVGPRPVTQDEIDRHYKEDASYYFMVRPGITGLWQVSGRSDTDYRFRVETDVWYVLNWTPWLDFMILAKTVWVVLRGKGAY